MILYHGTSLFRLKPILTEGIQPRRDEYGNWSNFPSKQGFVYLSKAYAPYYAGHATSDDRKDLPVIIEVSVREQNLYPDEDPMAQEWSRRESRPLREVHEEIDLLEYQRFWRKSLEVMGNVAHLGPIPAASVKRVAIVGDREYWWSIDPVICAENYRVHGRRYRELTKLAFGDADSVGRSILEDLSAECVEQLRKIECERGTDPSEPNSFFYRQTVAADDRFVFYRPTRDPERFWTELERLRQEHQVENPFQPGEDGEDDEASPMGEAG